MLRCLLLFAWLLSFPPAGVCQHNYNFRHLTATQGLPDGVVRAIGQDKYGYIWVSTLSGLSRFDGYTVKTFYNDPDDSSSIPVGTIFAIHCDTKGNLWLGGNKMLLRYDYATASFARQKGSIDFSIREIKELGSGKLVLLTGKGIVFFNSSTKSFEDLKSWPGLKTWTSRVNDFYIDKGNVYLATDTGVAVLEPDRKSIRLLYSAPGEAKTVERIAKDNTGQLYFTQAGNRELVIANPSFSQLEVYNDFTYSPFGLPGGNVNDIMLDRQNELWISTNINGLLRYNKKSNKLEAYRSSYMQANSLVSNMTEKLFQDKQGYIWVGTEGHGVDFFHPEKNLFSIFPMPALLLQKMSTQWARSAAFDSKNNCWLGTGEGVIQLSQEGKRYHYFCNEKGNENLLHHNSVRSICIDRKDQVWIGTRSGVNLYSNGRMRTLTIRDSLPETFYWKIFKDSRNTIWFAAANNIFYKAADSNQIRSVASHPILASLANKGARTVFEDSKRRIWFGMNGSGIVLFDPVRNSMENWQQKAGSTDGINGNLVTSITEDKNGIMWFAGFHGLTSFDQANNSFKQYVAKDGLPSLKLSGLLTDARNNLWIGSTHGLLVLDPSRKYFRSFDMHDGLPTMEFADMDATIDRDGRFIYPTMKGFVRFNPAEYAEDRRSLDVRISSVKVKGDAAANRNAEELNKLALKWDQNFFSFQLTAFNYNNPDQTWYAYLLEGFDKDWTYTRNREVNYTNVPGGSYTFRYKTSDDPNRWENSEKQLRVHIQTVFYKSIWFWVLVLLCTAALVFLLYKTRLKQQQRIFSLQTLAQALEKEKALVMYEGLKQQLNPHFLFNSISSLGSLIKVDQKAASHFLDGMSNIYRYILKSRDNELVPLGEEIAFVENYIRLQQTRFEKGFAVNINIPEEEYYKKIVPVTLQNLIENAIKHNIIDEDEPLLVEIYNENDYLCARNNLQRKNFVETSNNQGLNNLKSLYKYLTKRPIIIEATSNIFIVKIPLI